MLDPRRANPLTKQVVIAALAVQGIWPFFLYELLTGMHDATVQSMLGLLALLGCLGALLTWVVMDYLSDLLADKFAGDHWRYMAFLGLVGLLIVLSFRDGLDLPDNPKGFEVVGAKSVPMASRAGNKSLPDHLLISAEALNVARSVGLVMHDSAGGIAVFIGTTRAQAHSDSARQLLALDYQVYKELAEGQLKDIARRAREQWPILRLVIAHRSGRVPLSHPSVIIAVSTPHRADAFAACRWIIDTVKASAAIWKKEVWSDGTTTWVEPTNAAVHEGAA